MELPKKEILENVREGDVIMYLQLPWLCTSYLRRNQQNTGYFIVLTPIKIQ